MNKSVDVVVVGAGPVGLLTAIELTLGGASVLVLERLGAPSQGIKALSIGALGTEALQRRGMAAGIAAAEERSFAAMKKFREQNGADTRGGGTKFIGHFGGLSLIRKDAQREPERHSHLVDQPNLEAILAERSLSLGIEVRRQCEITNFTQQVDGVEVEWTSPAGAAQIRCSYLVGCDGGRSSVRKIAGFHFPGTAPTLTMYQAIAEIDRPELLQPLGWNRTSDGVFAYGPFPGRLFMLDFSGPPANREAPVTREEIEAALRHVSGQDVRVNALETANRWTDNTRLVDTYRLGRVLLAGDAAHVHSPFGGQGLSLGLVDAANLGWKLAAVVRGEMPESLLDTYTEERRPVAQAVLDNTLAQVAIMRPDPQSGAMRDLIAKLLGLDDANRLIGEMMSGLATRYDLGSEPEEVGRLMGDGRAGEASIYEFMQDGSGVLLDASEDGAASELVAGGGKRIRCVAVETGPSMLLRPDACVAWVGQGNSTEGLEAAICRWWGSLD